MSAGDFRWLFGACCSERCRAGLRRPSSEISHSHVPWRSLPRPSIIPSLLLSLPMAGHKPRFLKVNQGDIKVNKGKQRRFFYTTFMHPEEKHSPARRKRLQRKWRTFFPMSKYPGFSDLKGKIPQEYFVDNQTLTTVGKKIVPPDGGISVFDSLYNRGMCCPTAWRAVRATPKKEEKREYEAHYRRLRFDFAAFA
jgi:hypothetical protein